MALIVCHNSYFNLHEPNKNYGVMPLICYEIHNLISCGMLPGFVNFSSKDGNGAFPFGSF
jgi:hypothetical protein